MEEFCEGRQCVCCSRAEGVNGSKRLMPCAGARGKVNLYKRLFAKQLDELELESQYPGGRPGIRLLQAWYKEGDGIRADVADCIRGARADFEVVGVKVPEPGAKCSSLPRGLTPGECEDASAQGRKRYT